MVRDLNSITKEQLYNTLQDSIIALKELKNELNTILCDTKYRIQELEKKKSETFKS